MYPYPRQARHDRSTEPVSDEGRSWQWLRSQHSTTLGFLRMRAQVGTDPALLMATGADPETVARQLADDEETTIRAARMLRATPQDPPSIRMMGLNEADLDDWATPPYPEAPARDDQGQGRHERGPDAT